MARQAALRAVALAALALALLAAPAPAAPLGALPRTSATAGATATTPTPTATATTASDPNAAVPVPDMGKAPDGYRLTGLQVQAIAQRNPTYIAEHRKYPGSYPNVYTKGPGRWQVSLFSRDTQPKELAQLYVDDASGAVTEAWTGFQVAWTMARGYDGAFGRKVNSPWVWIPLTVLFVVPFVDVRRPARILHLDLAVLVAFGISVAFFNAAKIHASVPIVAPLMLYLLGRMAWLGFRRAGPPPRLHLNVPVVWLAVAMVFLVGFRLGLNLTSSNVIDVGYSGVIGADKLADGQRLYGNWPSDNLRGDTYGPVAYEAYVPFEQIFPWSGSWDELRAAHGAAIAFDLLTLALLVVLGTRIGGRGLGIVLGYAWTAWPFSLYALNTNTNDALVAVLGVLTLLVAARPPARGAAAALGGFAKLGSLALTPL